MANEFKIAHVTAKTVYVQVFHPDGRVRNVDLGTWVTLATANWGQYDIAAAEVSDSGVYMGDEPSGLDADTLYPWIAYQQAGGTPNKADPKIAIGSIHDRIITVAEITDSVWDELRADHTSIGSFGEGVRVESLNATAQTQVYDQDFQAITDFGPVRLSDLTVDGLVFSNWVEMLVAGVCNVTTVTGGNTVNYMKRNGTTIKFSGTVDPAADGVRTSSVIVTA
jgi:hypothetical protein